jgi:hypothetical protein
MKSHSTKLAVGLASIIVAFSIVIAFERNRGQEPQVIRNQIKSHSDGESLDESHAKSSHGSGRSIRSTRPENNDRIPYSVVDYQNAINLLRSGRLSSDELDSYFASWHQVVNDSLFVDIISELFVSADYTIQDKARINNAYNLGINQTILINEAIKSIYQKSPHNWSQTLDFVRLIDDPIQKDQAIRSAYGNRYRDLESFEELLTDGAITEIYGILDGDSSNSGTETSAARLMISIMNSIHETSDSEAQTRIAMMDQIYASRISSSLKSTIYQLIYLRHKTEYLDWLNSQE